MSRTLALVYDLIDSVGDYYRESSICRAVLQGLGLLVGLAFLDGVCGFPSGTRMAYVLPLWLATWRGGRYAGTILVVVTAVALTVIDSVSSGRAGAPALNLVLQIVVLYSLMRIFDSVESKLRNFTNLANRDSLTGLYNRLAIEDRAKKAIDRAIVMDQPLTIAMIDCDRFKELNDRYGHAFGDEVLRLLSKSMRRNLTAEATVGRAGGDEFIAIMPNRDRFQALAALEATLERFMSHTEIIGRSAGFSYGVAVVGENGFEFERLMRVADDDMYRRKASRSSLAATLAS